MTNISALRTSTQHLSKDEIAGISVALVLVLCIVMMTIYALRTTPKQRQNRLTASEIPYLERSSSPSFCCAPRTSRIPSAIITGFSSPWFNVPQNAVRAKVERPLRQDATTHPIDIESSLPLNSTTDPSIIKPAECNPHMNPDNAIPPPSSHPKSNRPTSKCKTQHTPRFLFFPSNTSKPSNKAPRPKIQKRQSTASIHRLPSLSLLGRRSTQARREEARLKTKLKEAYTKEVYHMRDVDMELQNDTEGHVDGGAVGQAVMGGLTEEGRGFAELTMEYERETRERLGRAGEIYRASVRGRKEANW